MVYIYLKDKSPENIDAQNKVLGTMRIKKGYRFYSETDVKLEYNWFSRGKGEFPEHLFPKDKINSYEDFTKYWNTDALGKVFCPEFGSLSFDECYGRTETKVMNSIAKYILQNISLIEKIDSPDFIKRCEGFTQDEINTIMALDAYVEPKKLPKSQRTKKDLQGGQWLCKSWSIEPFWVIYGNVDYPVFMKERIYEDDLYNNLYRDKKGYAFLLMPLIPIMSDTNTNDWLNKQYEAAFNMGLREHPNFILPLLYNVTSSDTEGMKEGFEEFYTPEEIKDRFVQLFTSLEKQYGYNNVRGFVWRDDEKKFKNCGWGNVSASIDGKLQVLTALFEITGAKKFEELLKKEIV